MTRVLLYSPMAGCGRSSMDIVIRLSKQTGCHASKFKIMIIRQSLSSVVVEKVREKARHS